MLEPHQILREHLDEDQQAIFDFARDNLDRDIIVAGGAGVGKSHLIHAMRNELGYSVGATTARAGLNIGGPTVDRLLNIDRERGTIRNINKFSEILPDLGPRVVLDEWSMGGILLNNGVERAKQLSGISLAMVGDWAQASPVKDDWGIRHRLMQEAAVFFLTKNHRQSEAERVYREALSLLRRGDPSCRSTFQGCIRSYESMCDGEHRPILLSATREVARRFNLQELAKLPGPAGTLRGSFQDCRSSYLQRTYPITDPSKMFEDARIAYDLPIKIGARVLITQNERGGDRYVNGDTGILVDILEPSDTDKAKHGAQFRPPLLIRLDRNDAIIDLPVAHREVMLSVRDVGQILTGYPLQLGYAQTIHSVQGQTLNAVWVDVDSITEHPLESRHGLAYVAMSRTRTLAGLGLSTWRDDAVYCNPIVLPLIR
jgi:hypothetical protein